MSEAFAPTNVCGLSGPGGDGRAVANNVGDEHAMRDDERAMRGGQHGARDQLGVARG